MTNKGNKKDDDFTMCLIENDLNGDTLVTWAYPGVEGHLHHYVLINLINIMWRNHLI